MQKASKAGLKEARELIKQKEYKDAIRKCKSVLKEDKTNYVALVLLGAAMQELEDLRSQAPLALKKATEIQPNNVLAWQGLVAFYEREPTSASTFSELINAQSKLLQLDSEPAKFFDILDKIVDFTLQLRDDTVLAQVLSTLSQLKDISSEERIKAMNCSLAKILTEYPKELEEYSALLEEILAEVCKYLDAKNRQEYYKKYLKILYKSGKLDALLTESARMHEQFSDDTYPLEWICRVYSEKSVANGSCDGIEIALFYETLLALNQESSMATMAKAVHFNQISNYLEARDLFNQVIILKPNWLHPSLALAEVNLRLYCFEEAERAAQRAEQLMKPDTQVDLKLKAKLALIEAAVRNPNSKQLKIAVAKCEDMIEEEFSPKLELLLARGFVHLEDSRAENLLDKLEVRSETKVEANVLRAILLRLKQKLEEAADVLGSALESSEAWLTLGKIHWEMGDYNHSLMAFLKGIHADPHNWECLVYLGHYYQRHGNEPERARRCYQKALQINPNSEEAGMGLSTAYRLLKNSEANMQLLQRVTMYGGGPKWAWLQLGLHHLDQGEPDQAVNSLRCVIRSDPNDNHCWEILADAYLARGAHTSALKSYQRALELAPGSVYPMIQIGNIKLMLSQFLEAKKDFEEVLSLEKLYIPALKGLAETLLGLSKEYAEKQLLGRSRDNAQQAVEYLTTAIIENSGFSCIWKLLGDVCYRVANLPEKYCSLNIAAGLVKAESQEDYVKIKRTDIFSLSLRSYCRALSLSPDSALLWHDLASCYLSQLRLNSISSNRIDVANKAAAAAKRAIKISPSSWMHWNLLGVICMTEEIKNYALSQHCYIMAIDMEPHNAVAWANLGTLYLYLEDPYRANEAFSRAQRVDPSYRNSWIGQALIAEKMKRKEAMDLFRHTTQLGYHSESALGYTHWVLTTLLDAQAKKDPLYIYTIENMHAISVATDVINWYLEHVPDDPYGLNAHGLLLERQKLYKPGVEAFTSALKLARNDKERDSLRVNLSRILLQLNMFDKAVELCQGVKNADFNSHCQLAVSLFKAERYEESYGAYEAALHWLAGSGSDKAHVLCAMAAMAYMFQGVDDAKTLLFQCIQIQPPTVPGLLAAAALGLLHQDLNLAALVLKELKPFQDHPEHRSHITLLSAYAHVVQNDRKSAIRVLSKAAHRHPADVESWVALVRFLTESDPKLAGNSAEKALLLGRKNCTEIVAQVACTSSTSRLIFGRSNEGLRSAQKTVHSFPYMPESWATLVAGLLPRSNSKESRPSAHWLTVLISIIRRRFVTSRPMTQWLSNNERKASLFADQVASLG